jgi:hypothetical protein
MIGGNFMERIGCKDYNDLAIRMMNILETAVNNYPTIYVYGHYNIVKFLLEVLISKGVPIDRHICLEEYDVNFYDKEFALCLTKDGVYVEKIWHDDSKWHKAGYLTSMCNVAFVHEDCNSSLLNILKPKTCLLSFIGMKIWMNVAIVAVKIAVALLPLIHQRKNHILTIW